MRGLEEEVGIARSMSDMGESWYDKLDGLLNIERVLEEQFHADDRVREAEMAALQTREASPLDERSVAVAEAFAQRVRNWRKYLREALREDGVPAPDDPSKTWLLFKHSPAQLFRHADGALECQLCSSCARPLSRLDATGTPAPKIPTQACANGLWQGPEPEEIKCLTWAERRVLRLAGVYCTITCLIFDLAVCVSGLGTAAFSSP